MAATVQCEEPVQHAATHNTVAYTVSETVQHEPLYSMLTLAFTVVATEPHEATLWHVAHNTVQYTVTGMKQHEVTVATQNTAAYGHTQWQ